MIMAINEKIKSLRELMTKNGVDAYLVTSFDPHMSEYPHSMFDFRGFITGFTGSSGTVIITKTEAVLFTDGRYFLQAEGELKDSEVKLIKQGVQGNPDIFMYINLNLKNACLGIFSEGISINFYKLLLKNSKNTEIKVFNKNLLEDIWKDRPTLSSKKVFELTENEQNYSRLTKLKLVQKKLDETNANFYIASALDDVAWVLNLRGFDIPASASFYAFLFISKDPKYQNTLFMDPKKMDASTLAKLEKDSFTLKPYSSFYAFLEDIKNEGKFIVSDDSNLCILNSLKEENVEIGDSIINLIKIIKSDYEIQKMKEAHIKDAVSFIKFLHKFKNLSETELSSLDEVDIALVLEDFRKENKEFFSPSFKSIIGFKENGAVVHYSPKKGRKINSPGLLLVDSGGSYNELGTTDITRTLMVQSASDKEKEDYTLVLQSLINLLSFKFLQGTLGSSLDMVARIPFLKKGLYYIHGTGHGVGFYLNVHELPVSISPLSQYAFKGSEITSIEPGIYRTGCHGVRLENLVVVKESFSNEFGIFLEFENLTLIPFEKELIKKENLSEYEIEFLNNYHNLVYDNLKNYLKGEEIKFLENLTSKI